MYFFKKNISNCLYIFFIFLTFNFIEFSTKEVLAKTFVVSGIEVEEKDFAAEVAATANQ